MQSVFADWASRMATLPVEARSERGDDELSDYEQISARGLEILQVLNDVFNTLPRETADCQD
jgi:hypothetical protein